MAGFDENKKLADQYLQRFRESTTGHFINGATVVPENATTFRNLTPIDNTSLGNVVAGTQDDVNQACEAAAAAFPAWRDMLGTERQKMLNRFADLLIERAQEIALVESSDCGQPIRFMQQAAVRGAENFRFFAAKATEAKDGKALCQSEHTNLTVRSPVGPVGAITPWNTPFMLATWKIAPALAAGCTIVHKPAEFSPLTATLLAEISVEAGLPNGVWNMVNGFGEVAGKGISAHPAIKAVSFVGETVTGSCIMSQGAPTLKRIHLELGGKNPVLVFDDADFERALDAVVFMIYSLNGQRCTSSSRLLVQSGIHDRFIAALKDRVAGIKVGHPLDFATEVGPIIHKTHLDKVMSYVDAAKTEGATVAIGGMLRNDLGTGNYVAPTLYTHASNEMKVAREEIFGPVLTCISFDTEDDVISIANDTPYGLAAYIWTNDQGRAMRLSHKIDAGMVWVNSENNRNLPSPFGGNKMSGIGRDGGDYSFEFYMETKNICLAHGTHRIPVIGKRE